MDLVTAEYLWTVEIGVGVVVLIFANWGVKRLVRYISERYRAKSFDWRAQLSYIAYIPLRLLIGVLGALYVIDILGHHFAFSGMLRYLDPIRNAAIVSTFAWILLRGKEQMQRALLAKNQMGLKGIDPGMSHILGRLSSIIIGVIAILIVLQILGLNIMPLLAFGGIGAAAIGFAAKDVIANFFGGLMLHITRPFVVGEWIAIADRKVEGAIEEIGWYLTAVRDLEKKILYIPNALFSTMMVTNITRMTHRRIEETLHISSSPVLPLEAICRGLKEKLSAFKEIDVEQPLLVSIKGVAHPGLFLYVSLYCLETQLREFYDVRQRVILEIEHYLHSCGVESAPTEARVTVINSSA